MTVVEIRITERIEADAGADGAGAWVVVARGTRPAARGVAGAPVAPRSAGLALDYAGWHARLAGTTRRA